MRRRNIILLLILVLTIVLISIVRFVVVRDTIETKKSRLESFSYSLDIHKKFVLSSYEKTAKIVFHQIHSSSEIIELLEAPLTQNSIQELQNKMQEWSKILPLSGVSELHINLTESPEVALHDDKNASFTTRVLPEKYAHLLNSKNKKFTGFGYDDDFIGFKVIFPLILNEKTKYFIEIGFDINKISQEIQSANKNIRIGYLIHNNPPSPIDNILSHYQFVPLTDQKQYWVDNNLNLPSVINEKSSLDLQGTIKDVIHDGNGETFSIYSLNNNHASAISFSELTMIHESGNLFLVSITNDHLLDIVKELNNAILVINIIIILLAMFGISYLIMNRLNIITKTIEIKNSEEKLKELNQSKDKFFSIIAHDLKNPFNGIMGMSGYLSMDYDNVKDEERREIIDDINIASKNAFNLLQNLLEWTRTQSGTIKNNPTPIDPSQIIEIALETVQTLAKNKEIEIIQNINTEAQGFADENLVNTVIRNLTTNAIKFSPRKSEIEIEVKDYDKELVFSIKDQGIGLHHDEIDKLFRIDVTFHKKGTEKETGTGLGLKLCKEFVEYCKGKIWVLSDPGKGSIFYFTIPKHES